jgi:pimeloyl-ACP methyl ester carboxylesterase
MTDYAGAVVDAAAKLPPPVALVGWSMGGLAALMAAELVHPACIVLLEASPPREAQGLDPLVEVTDGTYDGEIAYGPFPSGVRARLESARARSERKRGISVPRLACPSLVVTGAEFDAERGDVIARLYGSERLRFPDLDHWGLVLDPRVPAAVDEFLTSLPEGRSRPPARTGL